MVDRRSRDELAELLGQFKQGEANGLSLLASWPRSDDAAIRAIGGGYHVILGASHMSNNLKRANMRVTEMRDRESVIRTLDRTILFLQTDMEYAWRGGDSLIGDPTLLPFQVLAFVVGLPLMFLGMEQVEGMPSLAGGLLTFLMVLALVCATLIVGDGLRSLFTGIDRRVWPFYRRREYRKASSAPMR